MADPNQPGIPGYQGYLDANGRLLPQYQSQYGGNVLPTLGNYLNNEQGFNQLRSEALNTSQPSTWNKLANSQVDQNLAGAQDTARQQSAGATAAAQSNLAAGGLSSGARERIQLGGENNAMNSLQGLQQQALQTKAGNATQAESNRLGQLGQLGSLEQGQAGLVGNAAAGDATRTQANNMFNTQNAIGGVQGINDYNQGLYSEQMKGYAANQQARATAAAGGGGKGGK